MNVFSVLSLFASAVYVYIGVYTYRLKVRADIKRLIVCLCADLSVWSFAYAFVYVSEIEHGFWLKLSAVGWSSFSAVVLHTVLVFTENKIINRPWIKVMIYTPAVVFFIMSVFFFWPDYRPPKPISDFFYIGDFIYDTGFLLLSLLLIHRWGRSSDNPRKRKQSDIIVAASAVPFVLNILIQSILPLLGIRLLPDMGQIYALSVILGMYYAVVRYNLFAISPDLVIDEILAEMVDLIFLLSAEGKILKVNEQTMKLLGYGQEELLDKPLASIMAEQSVVDELLDKARRFELSRYGQLHCIKKNGERLPVRFSCSPAVDGRFDELLGIVLVGQDMTVTQSLEREMLRQKEAEERVRESEERFRAMFNMHTAVMILVDPETHTVFSANEAAQRFYGYTPEEFQGIRITDINQLSGTAMANVVCDIIDQKKNIYYFKHRLANGEIRDVEVHASPIPFGKKQMIFSVIHDVTERKKAEDHITYLAFHDSLTGLANRKHFYERLGQELERAKRQKKMFAVLYIDLDDFKLVNDTYGHETGDHLLCEVGKLIKSCLRESDMISRIGGDEFTLLIPDIKCREDARAVADKISKALTRPLVKDGVEFIVGASIGIGLYPQDGESLNSLMNKSDGEMYMKKRNRKEADDACLIS